MKNAVTILVILFLSYTGNLLAQNTPADYDTLFHAQVGPGMYHTEYEISSVPWHIQVMEIEISQEGLEFRTVKATNRLTGREKVSVLKETLEDEDTYVVGGVNGDFFGGGIPINAQVIDGELMKKPYPRELIAFDTEFMPWIATTNFTGEISNNEFSVSVDGINEARDGDDIDDNQIIVYNRFYGSGTKTNEFGTEIALKLQGTQLVNSPADYVVTRIEVGEGDMQLGEDDIIISAHGTAADNFDGVEVDDILSIQLNLNNIDRDIIEAIGGSTQFVTNGVVNSNWEERHPRTAVGFSQDTTKLYFVVVDGRQASSVGMHLSELGQFMVNIGVGHAINLDGGGSSALLVQDEIVNNPSDDIERSVANALYATLPNPGNGETNSIKLRPGFDKVFLGKTARFTTYEFDEFHRFSDVPSSEVEFSVDENIGSINSSGNFNAVLETGSGYVYATYGDFKDSAKIEIIGLDRLVLNPSNASVDTGSTFSPLFRLTDIYGNPQTLDRSDLNWSLTDPQFGEIDDEGNFITHNFGTVGLIASLEGVSDTTWVEVQNYEGSEVVSNFTDVSEWTIQTENLDVDSVSLHQLDDGMELRFSYPSQSSASEIILLNSLETTGVPKFADIVTSGDGEDYRLSIEIENENGAHYVMVPLVYANFTEPEAMHYPFEESQTTRVSGSGFYFPFSFEALNLKLPKNQTGEDIEGYFRFYSLGITYEDTPVSIEDETAGDTPDKIELEQNYPNPFNPTTNIKFSLPAAESVTLDVFDVLGRKVATLVDGRISAGTHSYSFDASNLSSGIYLYQLKTGNNTISRKMMLIK